MYKLLSVQARWDLQQEQMKYDDDDGRRAGILPREADRDPGRDPRHQRVCGPESQARGARSNQRRPDVARRFDTA